LVVVAAAALLTLSGTATAVAADRPDAGRDAPTRDAGTRDAGARHRQHCDRLQDFIAKLERAKEHLQNKIDRVKEKLASGELSPEEQARARALLEKLEQRLAHVETKIERLQELFAEKCRQGD
jgi:predicted RNase H-like nuclease (RuvC/YqgF family)